MMKTKLFLKLVIGLPLVIFVDYVLMAILGCVTCLLGFGDDYYCGSYCLVGKALLLFSAVLFAWFLFPEIKKLYHAKRHARA
jgi:energy-coupling factor transporter transmembrane protein EcfT